MNDLFGTNLNILDAALIAGASVLGCPRAFAQQRQPRTDAPEMRTLVAYIDFLSTNVPKGETLPGLGVGSMPELSRAADPARGKTVFQKVCVACHGTDGLGVRNSLPTSDFGYMIPPLWGTDSFNNGAGMARLSVAANFIHFNMPHGTDYMNLQVSVEDAWDVAAYMLSQPRPTKEGLAKDFPDLLQKPVGCSLRPLRRRVRRRPASLPAVRADTGGHWQAAVESRARFHALGV